MSPVDARPGRSSPDAADRFTATMHEVQAGEVLGQRPGVMALRIEAPSGSRDVVLQRSRVSVGAHPSNDVVLPDEGVSGVHCELRWDDGAVVVRDLGSKNGVWVGEAVRVVQARLELGARVQLGRCALQLTRVGDVEVPVSTLGRFGEMHGRGSKMGELFATLQRLASVRLDVLVRGETGVGKELVARGLHAASQQAGGPFVVLDCTNLNEGIAESVLFGHRRGAFTGANEDRVGLIEQADRGTLFIDEIGELPPALQPKLLRALERHEIQRVGEATVRSFDARIVAATHRDLLAMVADGTFREDLYFRLAQIQVEIPPLRERTEADITGLADLFLDRFAAERGASLRFDDDAYAALVRHAWPGNVRELRNVVRYAALWAQSDRVGVGDLPPLAGPRDGQAGNRAPRGDLATLEDALHRPITEARASFDRVYVARVLRDTGGNQSEAARRIGMSRSAFRELLKRLGL